MVVKVADARREIGECVSAVIVKAFTLQVEREQTRSRPSEPEPANPGHNPSKVPPVPLTIVENCPSYTGEASSIFTWKAESGDAPYLIYHVTPRWLTHVVRPGFAVLGDYPVLDIIETTDDGLPSLINAVELFGCFDHSMHGWRAWGTDIQCAVTWDGGDPTVEPLDIDGNPRDVPLFGTLL
ncbi:hypothetical protein [Nocardia carnea]|uniref:hypothetical protein n=1 Tax=Nocardia carnea TaxID=37328 RepID=UPI002455E161|nr:hypothetical protein [Nocardia carnea]